MTLITFVVMFIFFAIVAACKGDWSGIEFILKIIGAIVFFLVFGYCMIHPALLVTLTGALLILFLVFKKK